MAPPTRMQIARRRLRLARYSIGAAAVTAFAAFGLAVRDAHPATHSTGAASTSNVATSTSTDDSTSADDSESTFGGSAAISPAAPSVAPTIQSSGS